MCAFVVLDLVFHTKPRDWLGECLRNDLFCVELEVKLQLSELGHCIVALPYLQIEHSSKGYSALRPL